VTQAITLFYSQVTARSGLPFNVVIPTRETLKTFETTDADKDLVVCENADEMFKKLGI
jgi:DNA-damage-inducible protein J